MIDTKQFDEAEKDPVAPTVESNPESRAAKRRIRRPHSRQARRFLKRVKRGVIE